MTKGAAKPRTQFHRLFHPHEGGEGKLEGAKDSNIYHYLGLCERALGSYGLGGKARAAKRYADAQAIDCAHQGVILHRQLL